MLISLLASASPARAVTVPSNFVVEDAVPGAGFSTPVAVAFLPDGRWLVAEKRGRVYGVMNGVKATPAMISLENEVLNNYDRGLLGIAVDPNYDVNRYIYLLYTVDPDSNGIDDNDDAFARITRYQVSATNPSAIDPASRTVLLGVDWRRGATSTSGSHTIGSLRFGTDGSLLVSVGDGAHFEFTDDGGDDAGAFGATKTDPFEDIGAFRAQYTGSLAGKILRINPANGGGYPSNPFYDGNAFSNVSRVWAYGLRNPFRFNVRPGSGSTNPADGSPGVCYIGDVGWNANEEINVTTAGGRNFGWPCYEGIGSQSSYQDAFPAHHGCSTIGTPANPSPRTSPMIAFNHDNAALSSPPGVMGNAAIGGPFYTGTTYPPVYRQTYFYADYVANWIRFATVDANNNLLSTQSFATNADAPVDLVTDPVTGDLVYVSITTNQVRRIRYTAQTGNASPVVVASATPEVGVAPLNVQFSSTGTYDPDGDPLSYGWSFGDGQGATTSAPTHVYNTPGFFDAVLTVQDGKGGLGRDTVRVAVTSSAFPSTAVLDNFNRANGAIGGSWVGVTSGLSIVSNQLAQTSGGPSAVWNGATFGVDQEAYITLNVITANAPEHDLMLKIQGLNWDTGHIEVRYDANQARAMVSTYHPTNGWTSYGSWAATFAAGDRLGARAYGNGVVVVYKNQTAIGTTSVISWPFYENGGRIGLTLGGATSSRLDDFGGGNIVLNSNTAPVPTISSPVNNAFYVAGTNVPLTGSATDGQDPPASLAYKWEIDLHHNTHIHPNWLQYTGASASLPVENHDDGTGVHYEVRFIATDTGLLAGSTSVNIWPEVDVEPSVVRTTPANPNDVTPTTLSFTLRNNGRMLAPISRWRIRDGATLLAEGDTIIAPRDSAIITRTVLLQGGNRVVRVTADTLGALFETNESNNGATRTIAVVDGNPPTFTTGPTVTPATTSAAVQWTTNESAIGAVRYGLTASLGDSVTVPLGTSQTATLTGLARGTLYNFRVAATDAQGNTRLSTPATFTTLANRNPVAAGTATPSNGSPPLTVGFSAVGSSDPDGDPLTYSWAFGDATFGSGLTTSHVYNAIGTYIAVLTVSDGFGGSATRSFPIAVTSFPTAGILDDFNRANGALTAPWTGTTTNLTISSNELIQTANAYPAPIWNGTVFGPDQECYVTLQAITATSPEHDLLLKVQGTTWNAGAIEVRYDAVQKRVYVATYATTQSWVTRGSIAQTLVPGDQLGARATATGSVEVYRNGVLLTTVSVTGWPHYALGGRVGLTFGNATTSRIDNFGGGNVTTSSAPTATITAPANGAFFATGTAVNVNGSGTDAQDPPASLTYRWEAVLLDDGAPVSTTVINTQSGSFTAATAGDGVGLAYLLRLIVTDTGGLKDTAEVSLDPEIDLSPSALTITPDPALDSGAAGYSFSLQNTGRMAAPASRWRLRQGGTLVAEGNAAVAGSGQTPISGTLPVLAKGTYTLRVTVDTLAAVKETSETNNATTRSLTVADGTPPNFVTGPTVTPALASAQVQWTVNEAAIGAVRYGLTAALGDSVTSASSTSHSVNVPGLQRGTPYFYQVAATDVAGNTRLSTASQFTTQANTAPLAVAGASPASGSAPLTVTFSSTGSGDTNGDALNYAWAFGDGSNGSGPSPSHTYAPGAYVAILTVSDGFGGSDSASVNVVAGNGAPTASITAPANGAPFATGDVINVNGSGTDGQDPPASLTYRWEAVLLDDGAPVSTTVINTQSGSFTAATAGDGVGLAYLLRLIVTDTGGLKDTAEVSLDPEIDLSPSALTITPDPAVDSGAADYSFSLQNTGRMAAPASRWRLRQGGTLLAEGNAAVAGSGQTPISGTLPVLAKGTYTLRVTVDTLAAVKETSETNNATTRSLTVADGTPPGFVAGPTVTPALASAQVQWTVNEAAIGAVRYGLTAALGDSVTSASSTSHTVNVPGLQRGTPYFYQVAATDVAGNTRLSTASQFTTQANTAPLAVGGATPTSGSAPLSVTFNSTGSNDPNGDALSYAWDFGDGSNGSGPSPMHTYAAGAWVAILTVSDGFGGSDSASVNVVAGNGPPVATIDSPANGAFYVIGDLISLSGSATDPQNDPSLQFAWQVDLRTPEHVHANDRAFTGASASFTAEAHGAESVIYDIRLIVTDSGGLEDTASVSIYPEIDLEPTTFVVTPDPAVTSAGSAFAFTLHNHGRVAAPASRWRIRAGGTLVAEGDAAVAALDSAVVTGAFPILAAGSHTIRVRVDTLATVVETSETNNALTRSLTVIDNIPPSFTSGPTATPAQSSAQVQWVNNESTNGVVRHGATVALGDSVTDSFRASHTVLVPGLPRGAKRFFQVAATDAAGNTTLSAIDSFTTLPNRAPVAVATRNPASGPPTLNVTFQGTGSTDPDNDPLTYAWTFGDNTNGAGATVVHPYTTAGSYTAILTVSDGFGGVDTAAVIVTVTSTSTFPATAVLDNFNRANGALGSPWTGALTGLAVSNNALVQTASGYPAPIWNATGAIFGADQEAYVTLTAITGTSPEHDLLLKCQGTTWSAGTIEVRYDARSTVRKIYVATYTSTQGWVTRGTINNQTLNAGDQLGARAFANGNVEVYRNGVKLGTYSVGNWPHAAKTGRIGLTLGNATTSRLDDFGGGTLPPAAVARETDPVASEETPEAQPLVTLPSAIELSPAFPNPSSAGIGLTLSLPRATRVVWGIYDLQGRSVWSETRELPAGRSSLAWPGARAQGIELGSGLYLARIEVDGQRLVRRFALLR